MKRLARLAVIVAVAVLAPVIIIVMVVGALVGRLFLWLGLVVTEGIALATINSDHRRHLLKLCKVGYPRFFGSSGDDYLWRLYSHDHNQCEPGGCVLDQAKEYFRLVHECHEANVPAWRVILAA